MYQMSVEIRPFFAQYTQAGRQNKVYLAYSKADRILGVAKHKLGRELRS